MEIEMMEEGRLVERPAPFFDVLEPKKEKVKNKKMAKSKPPKEQISFDLELKKIKPLNTNQEIAFDNFEQGDHLVLHGWAGTGKTYLALYLSYRELLKNNSDFNKIIIIRSAVPSRDIGFLPGSAMEKSAAYEEPYETITNELFNRGDAYQIMKKKGSVEFKPTSYLRGVTYEGAIIIVDEIQNMTFQELDTIITRAGENGRIIFCGDYRQTDLTKEKEKSGLRDFLRILQKINTFGYVEFGRDDIVRSKLVKEYLIKKTEMGL